MKRTIHHMYHLCFTSCTSNFLSYVCSITDSGLKIKQETNNNSQTCGISPLSGSHHVTSHNMDSNKTLGVTSSGNHGDLSFLPTPESSPNTGTPSGRIPSPHMHHHSMKSSFSLSSAIASSLHTSGMSRHDGSMASLYGGVPENSGMSHSSVAVGAC